MTAHAEDMVLVPRAELDALRAENRRLRREAGDREALKRIRSDSGEGRTFTREVVTVYSLPGVNRLYRLNRRSIASSCSTSPPSNCR